MVQHPLDVVADARVHAGNALGAAEPGTEAHDSDYPPDGQGIWYKLPLFEYETKKKGFTPSSNCDFSANRL